jgi:hypothetical protein
MDDHKEPKTRKELKGNGKSKQPLYTQKHVRRLEALMERREAAPLSKKSGKL